MIKVQVQRDSDGTIAGLKVSGHAGYANPGEDIVCAGVTSLVVTALIGLKQVAKQPHEGSATMGRMHCKLQPGGSPETAAKAQVILETTLLGLQDIAKDYPKFIRVTEGG